MRLGALWTLLMLGLPQVAAADDATGAAVPPVLPGGDPAIERAETSGKAVRPALDLRIDDAMSAALPPIVPGGALALEHPETPGEAVSSELDLRTNPTQLPASPRRRARQSEMTRRVAMPSHRLPTVGCRSASRSNPGTRWGPWRASTRPRTRASEASSND